MFHTDQKTLPKLSVTVIVLAAEVNIPLRSLVAVIALKNPNKNLWNFSRGLVYLCVWTCVLGHLVTSPHRAPTSSLLCNYSFRSGLLRNKDETKTLKF